jgi:hypothetical protein
VIDKSKINVFQFYLSILNPPLPASHVLLQVPLFVSGFEHLYSRWSGIVLTVYIWILE